ncbi:MAG TPA: hypothetical protein VLZ83_10070 [Edaphocola sp.]|nr:hypothetical protein [Edaphocola sp.]
MADKFHNKYRIPSARLQSWDYSSSGLYFVTICTKNREPYFGEIINGEMHLSEIGQIVHSEWFKTFEMRPDMNLKMDEFVIMPNHFHAIICIGENRFNSAKKMDDIGDEDAMRCCNCCFNCYFNCRDAMHCVSTIKTETTEITKTTIPIDGNTDDETKSKNLSKNKFGPQSKNLASVIRGFKIGVTTNARKINPNFSWQSRYHDHIIRNHKSLKTIQNYIINNPQNWNSDQFSN